MKRRLASGLSTLILVGGMAWLLLGTTGCDNSTVYMGVSVAGPYGGYPYGYPYGGGYRGGVVYGRPYYR
jgi:hypothetical protein